MRFPTVDQAMKGAPGLKKSQFRWRRSARRNAWLRAALLLLALGSGVTGVWALLAPRSFFQAFPGLGLTWVSQLPPYNEHLVRDVGSLNAAFCLLFLWGAVSLHSGLVRAVSCAWLLNAVPHFVFHFTHLEPLAPFDRIAQTGVLALGIVLPLICLLLARAPKRAGL